MALLALSQRESYHMQAFDKKVVQTTKAAAKEISCGFSRRDVANKNGTTAYKSLNCVGYFIEKCGAGSSVLSRGQISDLTLPWLSWRSIIAVSLVETAHYTPATCC